MCATSPSTEPTTAATTSRTTAIDAYIRWRNRRATPKRGFAVSSAPGQRLDFTLLGMCKLLANVASFHRDKGSKMHYVLLATHTAELCPTSNSKTKNLMLEIAPEIPNIAQKVGVVFVAGPFVNREHMVVAIVEADKAESVDQLLVETRLANWNTVRILPSLPMEKGMEELQKPSIF